MRLHYLLSCFLVLPAFLLSQTLPIDTRVDQMRYWMNLAAEGRIPYNHPLPEAKVVGNNNKVTPWGQLSPDVMLGDEQSTRSENSVVTIPGETYSFFAGNNLSDFPVTWLFGADALVSSDGGASWSGDSEGAGGDNNGDPAVDCDLQGRLFSGRIARNRGQAVAWSDDRGSSWNEVEVASPLNSNDIFDKNHLCVDRSATSLFVGRIYVAWTYFGSGADDGHVFLSYSSDHGLSWSQPTKISGAITDVYLHHGVNIRTGPNGEVYAVWSGYDNWPGDESAILFARSTDGGVTFEPAKRIGPQIRGNRFSLTPKQMRVNAFPVMAVDCSGGSYSGKITVVWSNKGIPGQNLSSNSDIWCINSTDQGATWAVPIRISQNNAAGVHTSFFPWICCDDSTGHLFAVYYDDRNTDTLSCETWVAASFDGGLSWMEFCVSDVAFTPQPIVGMAASYFGDYIGITALNDFVCPVWTDNRTGIAASWCSPFKAVAPSTASNLTVRRWWLENENGLPQNALLAGDTSRLSMVLVNSGTSSLVNHSLSFKVRSPEVDVMAIDTVLALLAAGDSVVMRRTADFYRHADCAPAGTVECRTVALGSDTLNLQPLFFQVFHPLPACSGVSLFNESVMSNGAPDPGETFSVVLSICNQGQLQLPKGFVTLTTSQTGVTCSPAVVSLSELLPNDTVNLIFQCTWPNKSVAGQRVAITVEFFCGLFSHSFNVLLTTSAVVEDWESGFTSSLPWSITPDQPWEIDSIEHHSGRYSLRSASPPDNGRSVMSISYHVAVADSISFWVKTESEQQYDELIFRIGNIDQQRWSGKGGWQRVSFPVDTGYQTFTWIYQKDIFNGIWRDCSWVDDILLPPLAPAWLHLADAAICHSDSTVMLTAQGGYFNRLRWFSSGDGIFSQQLGLNAVYKPGALDRANGEVTMYGITYGNLYQASDTMQLVIQQPVVGPPITISPEVICRGVYDSVILSTPFLPLHSVKWFGQNNLSPIASQFSAQIVNPDTSTVYRLVIENSCGSSDTMNVALTVHSVPLVDLPADTSLCKGSVLILSPGNQFKSYQWSTGDTTSSIVVGFRQVVSHRLALSVRVENEQGCYATDSLFIDLADCVTDDYNQVSLFPQYNRRELLLKYNGYTSKFGELLIYSANGQLVQKNELSELNGGAMVVVFTNRVAGVYFYQITRLDGSITAGKFFW